MLTVKGTFAAFVLALTGDGPAKVSTITVTLVLFSNVD